jgi:hypothetical protein
MAVVNTFAIKEDTCITFELPDYFNVETKSESLRFDCFKRDGIDISIKDRKVLISNISDYDGLVFRIW